VCWLILHQVGYSLPIIGRAFSYAGRDYHHTTVMHGITRAKARLVCDAEFKAAYDALVEMAG
jgi:chromosomal replication initiation ATPase DnaA